MKAFDELYGNPDARLWAKEFVKVAELRPDIPLDENTMFAWFVNAMIAAEEMGRKRERMRGIEDVVREIAFQAAGAGSGEVMSHPDAGNIVMPSREIKKRVNEILIEFGIQPEQRFDQSDDQMNVQAANSSNREPSRN